MSHLAKIYCLFPRRITTEFVFPMMNIRRCVLEWVRYIYTGTLCCIVKLPDKECVSHTKRVGEIKKLHNYSLHCAAH